MLVAIVVASLCAAPPAAAIDFRDPARLALETDAIIDRTAVAPLDMRLRPWTDEILPWFAEEGIVGVPRPPSRVRYASYGGRHATHVLGKTHCKSGSVSINGRFVNPVSSMYRSVDMVLTLTHELAHVQQNGLCERASSVLVETSAQIMAFEVDAAMALDGNAWAGLALLRELRSVAVGKLQYDALHRVRGARDALVRVRAAIYTKAELAQAAQRARYLAKDPAGGEATLLRYVVQPYRKLAKAVRGDRIVTGLATPGTSQRPWAAKLGSGSLWVDDLAYFLEHADELYP